MLCGVSNAQSVQYRELFSNVDSLQKEERTIAATQFVRMSADEVFWSGVFTKKFANAVMKTPYVVLPYSTTEFSLAQKQGKFFSLGYTIDDTVFLKMPLDAPLEEKPEFIVHEQAHKWYAQLSDKNKKVFETYVSIHQTDYVSNHAEHFDTASIRKKPSPEAFILYSIHRLSSNSASKEHYAPLFTEEIFARLVEEEFMFQYELPLRIARGLEPKERATHPRLEYIPKELYSVVKGIFDEKFFNSRKK